MNDALLAPRRTLGRYEILGEIAQGAMGVVYKARDPLIDRIVAIKTVTIGLSDAETEAFERRFFREAKSAGRLNHPNVVTIHDVGKTEDIAYIAMEFLDGQSLREILDSGVVLPPQRIADIAAEIAEGLAFAHRNQVVHRDVKPANIMVLASGAVKITDFGIALLPTGTRTLAGNVFGSPRYTSPEQVMGRPVDGRSDIFSLGAVVYEMLTGKAPFAGDDLNGILKAVLSEPTPPPTGHNPKLPRAFDHIVGKALAKDPNDRYQDADEMANDLRHFDSIEFETPAPAPLPALEHPTHPIPSSATELASAADEEQSLPSIETVLSAEHAVVAATAHDDRRGERGRAARGGCDRRDARFARTGFDGLRKPAARDRRRDRTRDGNDACARGRRTARADGAAHGCGDRVCRAARDQAARGTGEDAQRLRRPMRQQHKSPQHPRHPSPPPASRSPSRPGARSTSTDASAASRRRCRSCAWRRASTSSRSATRRSRPIAKRSTSPPTA